MLYDDVQEIENQYFADTIYTEANPKIWFSLQYPAIKKAVNDIFDKIDGTVYDLYGFYPRGEIFARFFLSESNRKKLVPCKYVMEGNLFVSRLRQYLAVKDHRGKHPDFLLLYKKEGLRNRLSRIGFLWRLTRALNGCRLVDLSMELRKTGLDGAEIVFEGFSYVDIYNDIMEYEKNVSIGGAESLAAKSAMRCYADFFFIRDFVNAKKWFEVWGEYADAEIKKRHMEMWKKLESAFETAREDLSKKNSVLMNWIDGLRYSDLGKLPHLEAIMKQGIFFENMYTPALFSHPVQRAIFDGKLIIDDRSWEIQEDKLLTESKLSKTLVESGLRYMNLSSYFFPNIPIDDRMGRYCITKHRQIMLAPSLFFNCICLLQEYDNLFVLCHCMDEVHHDYNSPRAPYDIRWHDLSSGKITYVSVESEIEKSLAYLDEVISFYNTFFDKMKNVVWMSDHGFERVEKMFTVEGIHHVVFSLNGREVPCKSIRAADSLSDFTNLLRVCLSGDYAAINEDTVKGFSMLQREDPYGKTAWEAITHYNDICQVVQYRGVATSEDAYVRSVLGKEYYYREKDETINLIDDERFAERIAQLRLMAGDQFIDIYKENRYVRSRDFYRKFHLQVPQSKKNL